MASKDVEEAVAQIRNIFNNTYTDDKEFMKYLSQALDRKTGNENFGNLCLKICQKGV